LNHCSAFRHKRALVAQQGKPIVTDGPFAKAREVRGGC
jgi:hypothetical protein